MGDSFSLSATGPHTIESIRTILRCSDMGSDDVRLARYLEYTRKHLVPCGLSARSVAAARARFPIQWIQLCTEIGAVCGLPAPVIDIVLNISGHRDAHGLRLQRAPCSGYSISLSLHHPSCLIPHSFQPRRRIGVR